MDLRNLNLKLQNIRKELGQEASRVYSDLGIYIDTLMKNNVITISDDDEKNIGRKLLIHFVVRTDKHNFILPRIQAVEKFDKYIQTLAVVPAKRHSQQHKDVLQPISFSKITFSRIEDRTIHTVVDHLDRKLLKKGLTDLTRKPS